MREDAKAEGRLVRAESNGERVPRDVLDAACVALAAEQVGTASR
ncbi:hypothetical protein [Streptomyces sp. NPDC052494]